jgi:hypothetical protein
MAFDPIHLIKVEIRNVCKHSITNKSNERSHKHRKVESNYSQKKKKKNKKKKEKGFSAPPPLGLLPPSRAWQLGCCKYLKTFLRFVSL